MAEERTDVRALDIRITELENSVRRLTEHVEQIIGLGTAAAPGTGAAAPVCSVCSLCTICIVCRVCRVCRICNVCAECSCGPCIM